MLIKRYWIAIILSLLCTSTFAKLICPHTNQANKQWKCHNATIHEACNGKAKFIGVVYRADEGYLCMYQTSVPNGAFMVPAKKPPHPDTIGTLLHAWEKGKGHVHYHCVADSPKDCPLLTHGEKS